MGPWLLGLLGCEPERDDPRPALRAGLVEGRPVTIDAERAMRDGNHFVACAALKQRVRATADEADWARLLTTAARDPACLDEASGEALARWAEGRPGWANAVGEWDARHGRAVNPVDLSPHARLRVALNGTDAAAVLGAAEAALRADPADDFARAVLARAYTRAGDLAPAIEVCGNGENTELSRLRAAALDEAGLHEEAARAYAQAGLGLHAAAVLYQSLGRPDLAVAYLDEPIPPVALHRGWMALLAGRPPDTAALDRGPEAQVLRAAAGEAVDLSGLPGPEAAVLHALATGDTAALSASIAAHPRSEVLRRAELLALRLHGLDSSAAEAAWTALDPSTLLLAGNPGRREAPWAAFLPPEQVGEGRLAGVPAPGGHDEVGEAWRAALLEPSVEARDEALRHLQADHPDLRGLARIRAQLALGHLDTDGLIALEARARRGPPGEPFAVPGVTGVAAPP